MAQAGAVLIDRISAAYDPLSEWYSADHSTLELALEGTYVESGCVVSPNATPTKFDMTAGVVVINGVQVSVSAVTAFATTIATLLSNNSVASGQACWVAIEIDTSGAFNFHAGAVTTVATSPPVKPAITANRVCVGWVYLYYDPAFSSPTQVDKLTNTANGLVKFIEGGARMGTLFTAAAGRAGGQTVRGGTGSAEALTLSSTSHATKGKILFGTSAYDEANNRLGIGKSSPSFPLDATTAAAANSGSFILENLVASIDAASATTTSAILNGNSTAISTGNTATGFTGSLVGAQYLAVHNSTTAATNLASMTGMIAQALLGNVGSTNTPTATNVYAGNFQSINRSNASGTVVSGELGGILNQVQQVGQGTIALMRGMATQLTHVAGVGTAGTTTLCIGYDLAFSFFSAGTVTTAIGLRLQAWPAGPTYTNGPYGISVEGANSQNWIAGGLQIGGASRPTAAAVAGSIGLFGVTPVAQTATASVAPAGGTGTAAGGWDTSAHRDTAITLINQMRTALRAIGAMA